MHYEIFIGVHFLKKLKKKHFLYVTHVINYSRPSTAFPYCKRWKAGRGLGTRLSTDYYSFNNWQNDFVPCHLAKECCLFEYCITGYFCGPEKYCIFLCEQILWKEINATFYKTQSQSNDKLQSQQRSNR